VAVSHLSVSKKFKFWLKVLGIVALLILIILFTRCETKKEVFPTVEKIEYLSCEDSDNSILGEDETVLRSDVVGYVIYDYRYAGKEEQNVVTDFRRVGKQEHLLEQVCNGTQPVVRDVLCLQGTVSEMINVGGKTIEGWRCR